MVLHHLIQLDIDKLIFQSNFQMKFYLKMVFIARNSNQLHEVSTLFKVFTDYFHQINHVAKNC